MTLCKWYPLIIHSRTAFTWKPFHKWYRVLCHYGMKYSVISKEYFILKHHFSPSYQRFAFSYLSWILTEILAQDLFISTMCKPLGPWQSPAANVKFIIMFISNTKAMFSHMPEPLTYTCYASYAYNLEFEWSIFYNIYMIINKCQFF